MEINDNDTVIAQPVLSSPSASLIRTVVTVAWMSVLLGVGLELLLIALAAGAGTASKLQPLHRRFKPENILGLICLPAVAKVIAPAPVIVAPVAAPPVALARPKVTPALPPKAKNPTAGRTADARAQPNSHAHPYAGTGEIVRLTNSSVAAWCRLTPANGPPPLSPSALRADCNPTRMFKC